MLPILTSVLLFGLVHPLNKVILDTGIPLSYFCVLYVAIRFIVQVPIFMHSGSFNVGTKKIVLSMIMLGICGAGLQFFECKGVSEGLSPGMITFLMFSYPNG